MARATYGDIITDIKGSIGGHTFQHNYSSKIIRLKPYINNIAKLKLIIPQNNFFNVRALWNSLDSTKQAAWAAFADEHTKINKYNETKSLTGFNWFMSINCNLDIIAKSMIIVPPAYIPPPSLPIMSFVFTHTSFLLTFNTSLNLTDYSLIIFSTPPITQISTKQRNKYILTKIVNSGTVVTCEFLDEWYNAHGFSSSYFSDVTPFHVSVMVYCIHKTTGLASAPSFINTSGSSVLPFVPSSLSNLKSWWHSGNVLINPATRVESIYDNSGNSNTITQSVSADRPLYTDEVLNGYPIIRFNGINEFLKLDSFSLNSAITIFAVLKITDTNENDCYLWSMNPGLGHNALYAYIQEMNAFVVRNITDMHSAAPTLPETSWHRLIVVLNGASSLAKRDAASWMSGTIAAVVSSGFNIGSFWGTAFMKMDFVEFGLYTDAKISSDITLLDDYLANKYNL